MKASVRQYIRDADYERVGKFLTETYRTTGRHINWLLSRWEYMHFHPLIWDVDLSRIGIWEVDGRIVAVVHFEHSAGTAYLEIDPDCDNLKWDMLKYAEAQLSSVDDDVRKLGVYINDRDDEFKRIAAEMGYQNVGNCEPMSCLKIRDPFPEITLPAGFQLKSLQEENDLRKINRVMFRGFNHGEEPPDDGIKERKFMQQAPDFREDLNLVVVAPDGNFVAYCGMWYEPDNQLVYVEPVATDPAFRRLGLARALVLEGIRRCAAEGATVVYVGSTLPIYLSLGFRQCFNYSMWQREWSC
jgi:predicted N-acetyltransferase YhbS